MCAAERERRQLGRQHVVVIDDAPVVLDIVRAVFEGEQYEVTTTTYVPHTFDQIAALQPDLVLVDLVVGQEAGWTLLERLQAEAPTRGLPVLLCSTDQRLLAQAQADPARYGADAILAKPFELDDLLATVERLLGGAGAAGGAGR